MTKKRRSISNGDRRAYDNRVLPKATPEKVNYEAVNKTISIPILKAEQRIVTGIAMTPDDIDAHGEFFSEATIKAAAFKFLTNYKNAKTGSETKMGVQHTLFGMDIDLLESSVLRQATLIGNKIVKKGAWIVTVRVNDDTIWNMIKQGKITGFSIGGRAKAKVV